MRNRLMVVAAGAVLLCPWAVFVIAAQGGASGRRPASPEAPTAAKPFDPHDIEGNWRGDIAGNGRWDNTVPEPPLTDWARKNLLYKSISHDSFSGTLVDPKNPFRASANAAQHKFFSTDLYGVRANDNDGEYPGKDCEPLGPPASYDYPNLAPMELVTTREGDRIFQFFEYHREWRTFWLNRDHPKDPDPTYEGHSVAHWEGNTLVVDTVGFNGKSMVTGSIGHRKSESFRLVERFRRVDHDHLDLEMTFYDPEAWGDKASWPGFQKHFRLVPKEDFQEFICSPREYKDYDSTYATTEATGNR